MPRIFSNSPTTVTGRSDLGRSILLGLAAFGLTAGLTYRYMETRPRPEVVPLSYTATALVVESAAKPGAGEVRIPLSYTDADPRRAEQVANTLADRYVDDRRTEWKQRAEEARLPLIEAAMLARARLKQDEARLDEFRKQMSEAKATARDAGALEATIDNPQWIELEGRLEKLAQQRAKLLTDRTPLHPAVRDVTAEMEDVKQQMAGVPRTTTAPEQPVEAEPSQSAEHDNLRFAELAAAAEASRRMCAEAEAMQPALAAPAPQYAVVQANVVANSPVYAEVPARGWTHLLAGALMALGVGMVSVGTSIRPVAGSIGQVRADAGAPIVGDIPAADPVANPRKRFERQCAARRNLVGLGLILIAACPPTVLWGLTAISTLQALK